MTEPVRTVILDSEGLSRLASRDAELQAFLTAAARRGNRIVVPAIILAEVVCGRRSDAQIWHALNRVVVEDITRDLAGEAGALRERGASTRAKKRDLTVDAVVAAVARKHAPSVILTSDVEDLRLLCVGADVTVHHPADASR